MPDLERQLAAARRGPAPSSRPAPQREGQLFGRPVDAETVVGLQRAAGNAATTEMLAGEDPSLVHDVVGHGGGQPLPDNVRSTMEDALGQDFSTVRVHSDSTAAASAKAVQAKAYTVGEDIVLGSGAVEKDTLLHETTHVWQQRNGPVAGTPAAGGINISDPSDPFERQAEQVAHDLSSGGAPHDAAHGAGGGSAPGVQREVDDLDHLQRTDELEEGPDESEE